MDSTKNENRNILSMNQQKNDIKKKNHNKVNLCRRQAGSNWQNALEKKCASATVTDTLNDNTDVTASSNATVDNNNCSSEIKKDEIQKDNDNTLNTVVKKKKSRKKNANRGKYIALDCEMVGIGPCGTDDMLARVSIVNRKGEILLDKYVKPREEVTDYRTNISGIRPADIENGEDFEKVQDEVVEMLQNKILVGHAIKHDLKVLFIKHPNILIRDTSAYRPLAKLISNGATPSLKRIAKSVLGIDIQIGEHDSVEDARAAMQIYNRLSVEWEKYIQKKSHKYYRH